MPDEMDEIISDFIAESEESLDKIDPLFVELESKGYNKDLLHEIFRSMHTIKGAAGFLGFQSIVEVAHRAESVMKKLRDEEIVISTKVMDAILAAVDMLRILIRHIRLKDGVEEDISKVTEALDQVLNLEYNLLSQSVDGEAQDAVVSEISGSVVQIPKNQVVTEKTFETSMQREQDATLRIDVNRVDKVMDLTGEMVLARNRLLNISNYLEERYPDDDYVESLLGVVSFLDIVASDMQLAVMKMRMQPLKKVFGKFPRLVRDLSNNIGKEVELIISGEDTEVDRSVIEKIGDPMVHIIRNAIDHGIEFSEERVKKGKSPKGTIKIEAYQQGNQIIIEVSDDGRGIDVERVKKKAIERHLITEEESKKMSDENVLNLIFLPGFSTAERATELSGRGVGMDVVKTNISNLNGFIEVSTKKDIGTNFRISIPLTLAIINALMVRAGDYQYAVPLMPVEEIIRVDRDMIKNITGRSAIVVRDRICPVFELTDVLDLDNSNANMSEKRYLLVIAIGDRRFCIAVDELIAQEEVVIKPVNYIDPNSSQIIGATITGEGRVVLILDLAGISRSLRVDGAIRESQYLA